MEQPSAEVVADTLRAPATALGDAALADEIELYGSVVVAASEKDESLTAAEIDDALGVCPRPSGARTDRSAPRRADVG